MKKSRTVCYIFTIIRSSVTMGTDDADERRPVIGSALS